MSHSPHKHGIFLSNRFADVHAITSYGSQRDQQHRKALKMQIRLYDLVPYEVGNFDIRLG